METLKCAEFFVLVGLFGGVAYVMLAVIIALEMFKDTCVVLARRVDNWSYCRSQGLVAQAIFDYESGRDSVWGAIGLLRNIFPDKNLYYNGKKIADAKV